MPSVRVTEGTSIFRLAHEHRVPWRYIWDHEQNQQLRERSHNPGTLAVGEDCFVPDRRQPDQQHERGILHRFVLELPKTRLRLTLRRGHQPLVDVAYTLDLEGLTIQQRTGQHGELDVQIPATTTRARLTIAGRRYDLRLQSLAPSTADLGVQQRLRNLGYPCGGDQAGVAGPGTLAALNAWQAGLGQAPLDAITPQARDALRDAHGC